MLKKKLSCLSLVLILCTTLQSQAQLIKPCPDELIPRYNKDKRMWGYSDLFGMMVLEPIYTKVSPFKQNLAVVQKGDLSGVINCDGMVVLPLQYEKLTDYREGKVWAQKGGLWGLLDDRGRTVLPHQYQDINPILNTELTWVCKDKKWGLVDEVKGKILCPLQYDMVQIISANATLVKSGEFFGLANHVNCNYLLPLSLQHVKRLTQHELLFEQNNKWGIFHISGKMISEPQYDSIGLSLPNLFIVKKQNKYGLVNHQGLVQLPLEYDYVGAFSSGYAAVGQKGLYGYTTRLGKVYIPVSYEAVKPFIQGQSAVKKNGKWGIIDIKNQAIVPFDFDKIEANAKNTLWVLSKGGKYELFPVGTKQYTPGQVYEKVYPDDSTIVVRVVRDGEFYFYNSLTTHLAFNTAFEAAEPLYEGYSIVKQLGKYGVVNDKGTLVIPAEFEQIVSAANTKQKEWFVKKNGLWGLRNDSKILWPETYDWVYPSGNGLFKVKKEGKFGVVNYNMQTQGEIAYDDISMTSPEFPAIVGKSKKKGLLQSNGQLITPAKYDSIVYCGGSQFKAYSGKTVSLIKANGEAVKTKWKDLGYWSESLIAFSAKDKWGFTNSSMEETIPAQFDRVGAFYKGLAPATANGKTGVINKSGKWVIEPDYESFSQIDGVKGIVLKKAGKEYVVSDRGKVNMISGQ
ncbi:MAG: hypothetical protein K0R51_369 [Cytophagaceae bacterium]|nr:hypothetical protein [Cytophagaceae bacterium]